MTARTIHVKKSMTNQKRIQAEKFKNPIIGIQINLMRELQVLSSSYDFTSYKRKNIILDSIEQLANSGTGFHDQFMYALRYWRPNLDTYPEELNVKNDLDNVATLMKKQVDLRQIAQQHANEELEIQNLQKQIEAIEQEKSQYKADIKQMKQKLQLESDNFSSARRLHEELEELQKEFDSIFQSEISISKNPEIQALEKDNENLSKYLEQLKYEIEIANSINRRIIFLKQNSM